MDFRPRQTRPLHADDVEAAQLGEVAACDAERDDVARDRRAAGQERVVADARELVDRRQPADDDVVADLDMAGERGAIGEGGVLADDAVMRDVGVGKEIAVVADPGPPLCLAFCGSPPRAACGNMRLPAPIVVAPMMATWLTISTSSPILACGPIWVNGPTRTRSPSSAPGSTTASG
jgi:hypothetical protein